MLVTALPDPSVLYRMPAMPPPTGIKSSFNTPVTNASTIRILDGLFLGLATIFVLVRIYIRRSLPQGSRIGWDDATCGLAMVYSLYILRLFPQTEASQIGSIVHTVLVYLILDLGYGRHLWDIRAISLLDGRLTLFAGVDIVYTITIYLIKLSMLLLYKRLFSVYTTSVRLIFFGHIMIAFIMITALGNSIARISICTSVLKSVGIPFCSGKNVNVVIITTSTLNAFTDFYMLAIPVHRVLSMRITKKKKMGLLIIFLTGFV
ncbi:hypothetical protein GQ44DRAFT_828824 [Phaeosphaeriaceae sp. PMI808]|nr:hypothetical protein GQ44DRAFT_828824 [Phaeosphaeriaceae sp. PMI808]